MDVECLECLKKFYETVKCRAEFPKKNEIKLCVFRTNKNAYMKLVKTLGLIRERKILSWLTDAFPREQGYHITHYVNNVREPDFVVYDKDNKPIFVVESKNYGEKSYMLKNVFDNTVNKLCKYDCFRLLVLSSAYNLIIKTTGTSNNKTYTYYTTNIRKTSEQLRSKGIYTWILGYQDLMNMDDFDNIVAYVKKKQEHPSIEGWVENA